MLFTANIEKLLMNDIINASFELIGGGMLLFNVFQAFKDKEIKGVHLAPVSFFLLWGIWNLFYYPSLSQFYSFYAGCFLTIINVIWLIQIFYYKNVRN